MRQITEDSVKAFENAQPFKRQNMEVEVLPNVTVLKLHGNAIAFRYNDPERTLAVTNCGWESNTIDRGRSVLQQNAVLHGCGSQ